MHLRRNPLCVDPFGVHHNAPTLGDHVDHRIPRSAGGTDDDANLDTLCQSCHARKTASEDGGFGNRRLNHRYVEPIRAMQLSNSEDEGGLNLYGSKTQNRAGGLEETPASFGGWGVTDG